MGSRRPVRCARWLAVLVGLSAVVAASLATLDLSSTKRYEDLTNRSSALSVDLFGRIAGSSFPATAEGISSQIALFRQIEGNAREVLSTIDPGPRGFESAIARACDVAGHRSRLSRDIVHIIPRVPGSPVWGPG